MRSASWLRFFLINAGKLKDKKYLLLLSSIAVVFVLFCLQVGRHVKIYDDFSVFWNAGTNFYSGVDLYSGIGGACRYIYPPFAALLFQLFALFPVGYAAGIFTFINLLLYLFSIYLVRSIFELFIKDEKLIRYGIIFSVLFSFRFFLYHFRFVQMNLSIFVLCLMGVLFILKNKETPAVICFVIATFIKVIPVFFLIWLLFRGNVKTWMKIFLVSACCVLIPLLWRGTTTGIQDLKNYYTTFLEPFRQGRVEPEFHNQSLSAGIYKVSLASDMDPGFDYNILHLGQDSAKKLYQVSFALIFLSLLSFLGWMKFTERPISFVEIALVFLATHLLSGITWEYHFVSMLFVYMTLLVLTGNSGKGILKSIGYFLIAVIALLAWVGKDTVGTSFYHYLEGYSSLTWMMLLVYFYFLFIGFFREGIVLKKQ